MAAASSRRIPTSICCSCCPTSKPPHTEQVVEYLLYLLWDLGLKIGQSTRSVDECLRHAKADMTIRTALLEARYLWGEQTLFAELKKRFDADIVQGQRRRISSKPSSPSAMRGTSGSATAATSSSPTSRKAKAACATCTRCSGSPNTSTASTMSPSSSTWECCRRRSRSASIAPQSFLWTVRCHLHYLAGRAEDRLTFDVQTEIGRRMGYTDHAGRRGVERFMKHYFLVAKDVGDLTRIFCAMLEADQKHKRRLSWVRWGAARALARRLCRRRRAADHPVARISSRRIR